MIEDHDEFDHDDLEDYGELGDPPDDPEFRSIDEIDVADIYAEHGEYDEDTPIDEIDAPQHMLLSYLNTNHKLWIRCSPILEQSYFDKELQPVVELMRSFEKQNQKMPNRLVVNADTGVSLDEPDDADDPYVEEFISTRVEEFCRQRAAEEFLWEASEIIDEDRTRSTMAHLVAEMGKIASITVKQDLGYEVHRDAETLLAIAEKSDALPTGFTFLDNALNGGVTNPSYNLVSAASGQGKSIMLQNLAVNYARQGHNVVFITLELPEFMIEKRMTAMMTETDINDIYRNMPNILNKLRREARRNGKIQVKRMPMNGTTVADIRAYVAELIADTGEEWDHIVVDYVDLMKPVEPGIRADNIHLSDQAVSVEMYDWTHEPNHTKTIWSASQQTKGAKEEKDARQSAVSGGVGKVNTADNLLILKRTIEDIHDERVWVFIEKGRGGGQGKRLPFRWDKKTMRMSNPDEMLELLEEANTPQAKEKPNKKVTDPVVKAKMISDGVSTPRQNEISNKIRQRMNRGKT